jgi:flagellar basal body-associated protein FliL
MIKNKRGSAWIWILIILILVALGIGAYFLLSTGGSVPQPPALPSG